MMLSGYIMYISIFCTLIVIVTIINEVKTLLKGMREGKSLLKSGGVFVCFIILVFSILLFAMWAVTPVTIVTADLKLEDVAIITTQVIKEQTVYNEKIYETEVLSIDTISINTTEKIHKLKFGITMYGDTVFTTLE